MTEERANEIRARMKQLEKESNDRCNKLLKHLKQLLKEDGIDVPVRKYSRRRIEIKCFLDKEETEQVVKCISKNHPEWKFDSIIKDFYSEDKICVSIL